MLYQFFKKLTGVDLVKFAGFHEREQNSRCFSPSFRVSSVPGLAPNHSISQEAFLLVIIDGQLCVLKKTSEVSIVFKKVVNGFG